MTRAEFIQQGLLAMIKNDVKMNDNETFGYQLSESRAYTSTSVEMDDTITRLGKLYDASLKVGG